MKRMFFAVLLMTVFSIASNARDFVASGKTHSTFGDYKIEIADKQVTLNGKAYPAYLISYQNGALEVTLIITEGRDQKQYITLSKNLTVQYVYNEKYFGVEKLDKNFNADGFTITDAALNRNEYFYQKVITSGKRVDLDNIKLIAAYFPLLLKETRENS